jgi:hypothetical protein
MLSLLHDNFAVRRRREVFSERNDHTGDREQGNAKAVQEERKRSALVQLRPYDGKHVLNHFVD